MGPLRVPLTQAAWGYVLHLSHADDRYLSAYADRIGVSERTLAAVQDAASPIQKKVLRATRALTEEIVADPTTFYDRARLAKQMEAIQQQTDTSIASSLRRLYFSLPRDEAKRLLGWIAHERRKSLGASGIDYTQYIMADAVPEEFVERIIQGFRVSHDDA